MNPFAKIRHLENLHILLWLIKDSCWLMEWKLAGTIAFVPTICMALFICFHTRKNFLSLLANLSVLCWISANSCWMFKDFYNFNGQYIALTLFGLGLVFIFLYLYQIFVMKASDD